MAVINGVEEERLVMSAFNGLSGDIRINPPRGITQSQCRTGDEIKYQWTYLCPDDPDCFAVGYSRTSESSAKSQVIGKHLCPAPMRYSTIPTGKSMMEKLWDTADLAMRAYKSGGYYPEPDITGDRLRGYIQGVAEAIAISSVPYFRISGDVIMEINRRWMMHVGQIPWSPTPSYRFNPPINEWAGNKMLHPAESTPKPAQATRRRPVRAPQEVKQASTPAVVLSPTDEENIRKMHESGTTVEQLAALYKIGIGRVNLIVDPQEDILPLM